MSGIRVEKLEDRTKPKVPFPHKHDFYQILLISEGSGIHQIDFEKYVIGKNQIFIMRPGQIHSWKFSKKTRGLVIEFNRDAVDKSLLNRLHNSKESFSIQSNEDYRFFLKTAEAMAREFSEAKEMYNLSLHGYLTGLLAQITRESVIDGFHFKSLSVIERFQNLVEINYKKEHRVEFYANELGIPAKSFTMQITRAIGKSPRNIIQERFILEAKRLLAFSSFSINEIGQELGFEDANYFTRFFRLHEGVTPLNFRRASSSFL